MCPTRICRASTADRGRPTANGGRRTADGARGSQHGFTLAGLLVILTIMMIFIAYTVPEQWSKVMQREREKQTIFVMKQYARAIADYAAKHGQPTSMQQIKEARLPRIIRGVHGEWVDPMTGKVDWILIPPGAVTATPVGGVGVAGTGSNPATNPATSTGGAQPGQPAQAKLNLAASPKDYVGPFVGVRLPITGKAMLTFRESDSYENWFYTTTDLAADIKNTVAANPNQ
jgi:type II secretory pathway pseudopilin PulG